MPLPDRAIDHPEEAVLNGIGDEAVLALKNSRHTGAVKVLLEPKLS